jgi:hypothetical protein
MQKLSDKELLENYCLSCMRCERLGDDEKESEYRINFKLQTEIISRLDKDRKATEWQPIETAPKDKLILLYLPEFGCSAATWWSGQWSWELKTWVIRTPFLSDNKIVMASDIPFPLGWIELPDAIADYEKEIKDELKRT